MTYLIPVGTPRPPQGDQSLWESYELFETDAILGPAAHQAVIQDRLDEFKALTDVTVHIEETRTLLYITEAPMPTQRYLTTIRFSAISSPDTYPIPPA